MPIDLPRRWESPLILLAALLWLPGAGGNSFLSDDIGHLLMWGTPPFTQIWKWFYTQDFNYYRPLTALLWKLNYTLWGLELIGYQLVNFALHAGCALLVLQLGRALFPAAERVGLCSALVFLFLPGHIFGVLNVSAVTGLLCALWYLAAALAYLRGREGAIWGRVLGPFFFLLALLTKEQALALPLLIGLWEVLHLSTEGRLNPANWLRAWLPYGLVIAGYLLLRWALFGHMLPSSPLHAYVTPLRLLVNTATYAAKGIAPWGLEDLKPLLRGRPIALALLSGLLLTLALAAMWRWRRALGRGHVLALAWFGIALLPVVSLYSPWNTYLPAAGTALLLGALGAWQSTDTRNLQRVRQITVAAFLGLSVTYSLNHQQHWYEARALCQQLTDAIVELDGNGPVYLANLPAEWNDAPLFVSEWALRGTLQLRGSDRPVSALSNVVKGQQDESVAAELVDDKTFILRLTAAGEFFRLDLMDVLAGARRPERGLAYGKGPFSISVADLNAQGEANALRVTGAEGIDRVYLWNGARLRPLFAP